LHETPQIAILKGPQNQIAVIRHAAIAQHTYKHLGLSFFQGFFERIVVSVIVENPIPGISTVYYSNDHSARRLGHLSWHADDDISRKCSLSTMIWTSPRFFSAGSLRKIVG
jgi:hypothetical protein